MKSTSVILLLLIMLGPAVRGDLSVFAAASTTDAMKALTAAFSEAGGERIRFNFAGSGTLARQIDAGAPADIFVSANMQWMDWLEEKIDSILDALEDGEDTSAYEISNV